MPYYRTKSAPRRSRYRRRYRKKSNMRTIARSEVRKQMNRTIEHKDSYQNITLATITYNGDNNTGTAVPAVWSLYPTVAGYDDGMYIGRNVKVCGISGMFNIVGTDSTNMIRIIIVQWKGATTVSPNINEILEAASIPSTIAPLARYNDQFRHRFKVLYNRVFNTVLNAANNQHIARVWIPGRRIRKIQYTDTSGDIQDGEILMYAISDSAGIPHPILNARMRIYYTDA